MRLKYEPYRQINNYWHPLVKTGENPYEKNEPSLSLINSSRTANVSQLIPRKQQKKTRLAMYSSSFELFAHLEILNIANIMSFQRAPVYIPVV